MTTSGILDVPYPLDTSHLSSGLASSRWQGVNGEVLLVQGMLTRVAPAGRSFHQFCGRGQGLAGRTGPEKNLLNTPWFCPCNFAGLGACWFWSWSANTSWFHLWDMSSSMYNASHLCCVCCGTHICTPAVLSVFVTAHSLLLFGQTLKRTCGQFIFIQLVFFVLHLIVYSRCCCSHLCAPNKTYAQYAQHGCRQKGRVKDILLAGLTLYERCEWWIRNLHIDLCECAQAVERQAVTKLQILKHKGRHLSISCNDSLLQDSIPLRMLLEADINKFSNYCNITNPVTIGWPQIGQTILEAGFSEHHTDNQQQMLLKGSSWTTPPILWITYICPLSCNSIWALSWQPISTRHHLLTSCLLFIQGPAKSDSPIRHRQTRIPLVSIQMFDKTREGLITSLSGLGGGVCLVHSMYNHCAVVCHNISLSW